MTTLTIQDESTNGSKFSFSLEIEDQKITVKQLIEQRVVYEVNAYNSKMAGRFNGLVQPAESEVEYNGYKLRRGKSIDAETQVYIALAAFKKNKYILLLNDHQAESLDEIVDFALVNKVTFIRLVPLAGG